MCASCTIFPFRSGSGFTKGKVSIRLVKAVRFSALLPLPLLVISCAKAGVSGPPGGGGTSGSGVGGIGGAPPVEEAAGTSLIAEGATRASQGKCEQPATSFQPVRRISRIEYDNAVRDLFGVQGHPASGFVAEEKVGGFDSNSRSPVSELAVEQYLDAAEAVAAQVLGKLSGATGCTSASDQTCIGNWLTGKARLAFRGNLPDDEKQKLLADYGEAAGSDATNGFLLGVEAILTSPRFLYVLEQGKSSSGGVTALTGQEVAGRLAAALWRSVPDEALLADADSGKLDSADGVKAAARRMLSDSKATGAIEDFAAQWLRIDQPLASKDKDKFPTFSPALATAMGQETRKFFSSVFNQDKGSFSDLLTAGWSNVNKDLASLYGVSGGADDFPRVNLGPERKGVLTQASVLAAAAHPAQTSPTLRGKLIRDQFLCDPIAPPPPDVNTNIGPVDGKNDVQVFEEHASQAKCRTCHMYLDEIGKGFARFDAIGAYRTDGNAAGNVVAPASLSGPDDVSGPFSTPADLAMRLAGSQQVQQCYALQTFRFALGRVETMADACSANDLWQAFSGAGLTLKEAVVALTGTPAFRYRNAGRAGASCR